MPTKRRQHDVNHKRAGRTMRKIELRTVYPRPRTDEVPVFLRGLDINRPCQIWAADIPYLPMPLGFMYIVAAMDWFRRFVLV